MAGREGQAARLNDGGVAEGRGRPVQGQGGVVVHVGGARLVGPRHRRGGAVSHHHQAGRPDAPGDGPEAVEPQGGPGVARQVGRRRAGGRAPAQHQLPAVRDDRAGVGHADPHLPGGRPGQRLERPRRLVGEARRRRVAGVDHRGAREVPCPPVDDPGAVGGAEVARLGRPGGVDQRPVAQRGAVAGHAGDRDPAGGGGRAGRRQRAVGPGERARDGKIRSSRERGSRGQREGTGDG